MKIRAAFAFASILGASNIALAQGVVDPGLNLLRERQKIENLRHLQTAPQGSLIEAPVAPSGKSTICFNIHQIEVDGIKSLRDGSVDSVTFPFRWRCLGQNEIEQLVQKVRQFYLERGYITTQVVVPAQDLKSGTLRLAVVEGRVARVVYGILRDGEKPRVAPFGKLYTAFQGVSGGTLQLRDLEQGVAQINRNPSSSASIDILPGDEPGTSLVKIIEKQQRPWRVTSGFDTNGQASSGRLRLRAGFEADNLLALNDNWSTSFAGSRASNALAATVSVPFGYWTLSSSSSYSQQGQLVSQVADMVTESVTQNLTLDRVLYRDAGVVFHVNQSVNWYWNRRFINATALTEQFLGWTRSGAILERYFEKARISLDAGVSWGLPKIARTDDPLIPAPGAARARFSKIDGTLTYLQSLGKDWSFLGVVTGQYSSVPLYAANQIAAGGSSSVRGFRDLSVSGDTGYYVRTELQRGTPLPWARAANDPQNGKPPAAIWSDISLTGIARQLTTSVTPYVFADAGTIRSNGTNVTKSLASVGGGLRSSGERVTFDITIAQPLIRPTGRSSIPEVSMSMNVRLW